jgi:hypothetical protein
MPPNLRKTLLVLSGLCFFSIFFAYLIQSRSNRFVNSCSYLDPITVDIAALIIAMFFIFEGLFDIFKHQNSALKNQFSRILRICFAVSILTIHIMQFIYK